MSSTQFHNLQEESFSAANSEAFVDIFPAEDCHTRGN
jgi:hypothetical protein